MNFFIFIINDIRGRLLTIALRQNLLISLAKSIINNYKNDINKFTNLNIPDTILYRKNLPM